MTSRRINDQRGCSIYGWTTLGTDRTRCDTEEEAGRSFATQPSHSVLTPVNVSSLDRGSCDPLGRYLMQKKHMCTLLPLVFTSKRTEPAMAWAA